MIKNDRASNTNLLLFVSGLAGAGKTVALRALEDIGFVVIDNLPALLLSSLARALTDGRMTSPHIALSLDTRDPAMPSEFLQCFDSFTRIIPTEILFLEALPEVLQKRYRETRRKHPLNLRSKQGQVPLGLDEAIQMDIQALTPIRQMASHVVDTSGMTGHYLRQLIWSHYSPGADFTDVLVNLISFGFKYGVPQDVDTIFDVRCFSNPHYVDDLRPLTGLDPRVRQYVFADPNVRKFVTKVSSLLRFLYPLYRSEGKSYLGIGIGCTGGKHRSVAIVEELRDELSANLPRLTLEHRHFDRE